MISSTTKLPLTGGCLCGAVRYQLSELPFAAEYCHCRMCQIVAGSPVATWMDVKAEQFTLLGEDISEYKSSEFVYRGFCPQCGSTLSFRDSRHSDYFTLSITSLDHPNQVAPTYHIFTESKLDWFDTQDSCKRFNLGAIADK